MNPCPSGYTLLWFLYSCHLWFSKVKVTILPQSIHMPASKVSIPLSKNHDLWWDIHFTLWPNTHISVIIHVCFLLISPVNLNSFLDVMMLEYLFVNDDPLNLVHHPIRMSNPQFNHPDHLNPWPSSKCNSSYTSWSHSLTRSLKEASDNPLWEVMHSWMYWG